MRRPDKRALSALAAPLPASRLLYLCANAVVFVTDPERQRRLPIAALATLYRLISRPRRT